MKRQLVGLFMVVVVAGILAFPSTGSAFTLSGTDFTGYMAYDGAGDVIGAYGLDPRFSYENTGMNYNTAAAVNFSFQYDPSYPSLHDVALNPDEPFRYTITLEGGANPMYAGLLPSLTFQTVATYNDFMGAAQNAWTLINDNFPAAGCYAFDYMFTGPNTGYATLSMAANIDWGALTNYLPDRMILPFGFDSRLTVTAEPVPEPLTLTLFGVGLAGVGLVRRRKALNK
jgi:hypothetical protein